MLKLHKEIVSNSDYLHMKYITNFKWASSLFTGGSHMFFTLNMNSNYTKSASQTYPIVTTIWVSITFSPWKIHSSKLWHSYNIHMKSIWKLKLYFTKNMICILADSMKPVYNAYFIADVYHIRYSLKTCYIRMKIQQNAYHINLSFWLLPGTSAKPSIKLSSAFTRNVQWTIRVLHII